MAASILHVEHQLCRLLQVIRLVLRDEHLRQLCSSMMMLNSFQQFVQQIPVITTANLLAMATEANRSPILDPLAEIRNGQSKGLTLGREKTLHFSSAFESRTRVASFPGGDHRFRSSPCLQVTAHFHAANRTDSLLSPQDSDRFHPGQLFTSHR
jgi:hypothetical protein